jgi:hypothetical protein
VLQNCIYIVIYRSVSIDEFGLVVVFIDQLYTTRKYKQLQCHR